MTYTLVTARFKDFNESNVQFLMLQIKCKQAILYTPSLYDLDNLFRLTSIYSMPRLKVLNCYDFFVLTDVNLALLSLKKRLPHVTINEKRIAIAENGSYKNGIWDVKAQQLELDHYQMPGQDWPAQAACNAFVLIVVNIPLTSPIKNERKFPPKDLFRTTSKFFIMSTKFDKNISD